jgi:DNA-binding NarL/FixJ family response regulator
MIRVFIFSDGTSLDFLLPLLNQSNEVQIITDPASAEVLLIHTPIWNRETFNRVERVLDQYTKPAIVFCEEPADGFSTDSILRHKVAGVLKTNAGSEQIVAALRAAAAGLQILFNRQSKPLFHEQIPLTPRELEVLRLIADGEGNKSIAYVLKISEHTVKFHISSIFEKLHVGSRTEAVKAGIMEGIISI